MWKQLARISTFSLVVLRVNSRDWHNTGTGTIIFEEAWTIPELLAASTNGQAGALGVRHRVYPVRESYHECTLGGTVEELAANLLDIHNQRLGFMNANNVDFVRILF